MRFIKDTNIDFMKYRKIAFIASSSLVLIGLISFFLRGPANFGIDFTGGTLVRYKFSESVNTGDVRNALAEAGLAKSTIQSYNAGKGVLIKTAGETRKEIQTVINSKFVSFIPLVEEEITIGPVVGNLMKRQALIAVFFALIGILIYTAWRFKFTFGFAAVICLFHDVLFTVGIFSLARKEISLSVVAALLTIVGYSLNDTIVVFDRIRENMKLSRHKHIPETINASINQTLPRTIITSGTTLVPVLALLFLGGPVIKDFAFALAVGIVVGTYSSIYIASPLVIELSRLLKVKIH
ncbi:MAG: protein translocase subunit SecF [Candidatus Omnitrophica bacterium]|nr:protein translocase subunit SecF [Candidatus Omnitrophota bacterium]MBU1048196.1 protein translocase subunit SecF [Candidatus Omnitrophota bacterium]MBU1631394.1 protein translocase subunit SecF [Candidatus Omnitrophota bacterium]MBU1766929.1 protein translocase subunit SecF [Candidatus Omnitrophota bacterium]MBU1888710.1 protein translocase subunit SecF [Candidatus Omnitrophota bacterium]